MSKNEEKKPVLCGECWKGFYMKNEIVLIVGVVKVPFCTHRCIFLYQEKMLQTS